MRSKANGKSRRVEPGEHIVADPLICHGKPTFTGTRINRTVQITVPTDGMSGRAAQ